MSTDNLKVLDHGYIRVVESWGSDERIIEAARMSTQKGFEGWGPRHAFQPAFNGDDACAHITMDHLNSSTADPDRCRRPASEHKPGDEKLLRYLWKNNHATPFEMAGLVIEVQAPIFVFREWHRHRTQSYNEMSARYAPLPDVNYIPTVERLMLNGGHLTRQAGAADGADVFTRESAEKFRGQLEDVYEAAQALYEQALAAGTPKELARICLPVGRYSRMRASANLRNWLAFLTLREAPQAQWEIRQYAEAVHALLGPLFPRTIALFEEGRS